MHRAKEETSAFPENQNESDISISGFSYTQTGSKYSFMGNNESCFMMFSIGTLSIDLSSPRGFK